MSPTRGRTHMIVHHGTTQRRAWRICREGFLPRKPSRRVWFARSRAYALGRAKTQARRAHDRAVVLTCELDLPDLLRRLGPKRVLQRSGIIAVDGHVPVSVLRSHPAAGLPGSPRELARWVNDLLGLKPHRGVARTHPGVVRLARWIVNRLGSQPGTRIKEAELLHYARQWLPEYFRDVEIDPETLKAYPKAGAVDVRVESEPSEGDPRRDEAIAMLESERAETRARGLTLLARTDEPDLFDWCAMFLDDAPPVRLAALQGILRCEDGEPGVIAPLAESPDKRIRAAAVAALARHAGRQSARWFRRGLKDSSACVRLEVARQLPRLDPRRHRRLFELALTDPNPKIVQLAEKLTEGQGFAELTW